MTGTRLRAVGALLLGVAAIVMVAGTRGTWGGLHVSIPQRFPGDAPISFNEPGTAVSSGAFVVVAGIILATTVLILVVCLLLGRLRATGPLTVLAAVIAAACFGATLSWRLRGDDVYGAGLTQTLAAAAVGLALLPFLPGPDHRWRNLAIGLLIVAACGTIGYAAGPGHITDQRSF